MQKEMEQQQGKEQSMHKYKLKYEVLADAAG